MTMHSRILIVTTCLVCSVFGACKTLTVDNLKHVSKGLTVEALKDTLDSEPRESTTISHNGKSYILLTYPILVGVSSSKSYDSSWSVFNTGIDQRSATGRRTSDTTARPGNHKKYNKEYVYMMYLFEDNKLIYWGYMNEFIKAEDPRIADIASSIYSYVFQDNVDLEPYIKR